MKKARSNRYQEIPEHVFKTLEKARSLSTHTVWFADEIASEFIWLLVNLDRTKDPKLLLPYLNVPKAVMPHLEDLFDRHRLQSKARRIPSYQRTDHQIRLMAALAYIKQRSKEMSEDDAVEEAASIYRLNDTALHEAVRGGHRSLRQSRKK